MRPGQALRPPRERNASGFAKVGLERILELRAQASPTRLAKSKGFLLPRVGGRFALFQTLRLAWIPTQGS